MDCFTAITNIYKLLHVLLLVAKLMNFEVFVQVNMRILFFWDTTLCCSVLKSWFSSGQTLCQWVGESKCWLKCPATWRSIHPDAVSHPRESSTFMKFVSSKFKVNSRAWNSLMFNWVKVPFNVMWTVTVVSPAESRGYDNEWTWQ